MRNDAVPNSTAAGKPPRFLEFQRFSFLIYIIILIIIINLLILLSILASRPGYLRDAGLNENPDAVQYVLLGRNTILHGVFSRARSAPYTPDMLRTPVYPLFAGALDLVAGSVAIYLAQVALAAGSCFVLYRLVSDTFGPGPAAVAGLLFASDLMFAIGNYQAMSEPLFVFLVLVSTLLVSHSIRRLTDTRVSQTAFLAAGIISGLAILTRPVALYLLPVQIGVLLLLGYLEGRLGAALRGTLLVTLGALPLPGLWIARNAYVFSLPKLTTVDRVNLVYFVGAGAYQARYGVTLEEAQDLISRDFEIPSYVVAQNPARYGKDPADLDRVLKGVAPHILAKHPADLFRAMMTSLVKASFSHNAGDLAWMLGKRWSAPGAGSLLRGDPVARERLRRNSPFLTVVFIWQVAHVCATIVFAVVGVILGVVRHRLRRVALVPLATLLYFYLTITLFGFDAYHRCRVPLLPYLYAFAGLGVCAIGSVVRPGHRHMAGGHSTASHV